MSEPKLISPLLDGFVMGDPISNHDGVCCCPAMRVSDESKYIVKIISIPASQTKLEALLLAGAFADREAASQYFHELAQDIVEDASLLQRLSRLEGFVSYEGWQVVPMEDATGYDVYLLAPYRPTLVRHSHKNAMTQLEAVNLGLDLCSALAACRRSGYLYVDLRPENIFICADNEYKIGDLGFLKLNSLQFASLPEKYHSVYTAPEITDAYSALNDKMDIYAAGLVLYQVYNGGTLPENAVPGQPLAAPEYADPQMAEIILKACAPDPAARWEDPVKMGQALVNYMQTNGVNNTPIVPVPVEEPAAPVLPEVEEADDALRTEDVLAEVDEALDVAASFPAEEIPAEAVAEETPEPVEIQEDAAEAEETPEAAEEPAKEVSEEAVDTCEEDEPTVVSEDTAESISLPEEAEDTQSSDTMDADEITRMLQQADDLIAHNLPAPVVAPDPIEIPMPEPIVLQSEEKEEIRETFVIPDPSVVQESADPDDTNDAPATEEAAEEPAAEEDEEEEMVQPKSKKKGLIATIIILLLVVSAAVAGYLFYNNYYIQPILAIDLDGAEDRLVVTLNTETDNTLLTVYCTDTYGNSLHMPVVDNTATFTGLRPNTRYTVHVEIDGFHKLIGTVSDTYSTAEQTVISDFTAVTGDEDGSVILNFTVQGPEAANWKVTYSCPGEAEQEVTFAGHMTIITGLTVGKTYTFHLEPSSPLYVVGDGTLEFTASSLIYAQDLIIESFRGGVLTTVWAVPENTTISSWTVRCSNDAGFNKTIQVTDPKAVFEGLDPNAAYTVQVTADGMTVSASTFITANSVTIDGIYVDDSIPGQITLNWTYEGNAPEGGWLVLYTITGYVEQQVIRTDVASATITPVIPGSSFSFDIQSASGSTVFGESAEYQAATAEPFEGYMLTAADFNFRMCRTPANPSWGQANVPAGDYVNTFTPGEQASFAIFLGRTYGISQDEIRTLAVIRDEEGNVVNTLTVTRTWSSMWYRNFGKLDLFEMPEEPGNYTIEVYFNEMLVTTQNFSVA